MFLEEYTFDHPRSAAKSRQPNARIYISPSCCEVSTTKSNESLASEEYIAYVLCMESVDNWVRNLKLQTGRLAPGRSTRGLCSDARAAVSHAHTSNPRPRSHTEKNQLAPAWAWVSRAHVRFVPPSRQTARGDRSRPLRFSRAFATCVTPDLLLKHPDAALATYV
jgi:hypothetical protein